VGTIELEVPRDREGRFQTQVFERYQRSEKALLLAVAQMYVQGVSTRKVKKITEALCGLEVSRSQVSELAKGLDGEIAAWRSRPLEQPYPYLVVDAHYEKVRRTGRVVSEGVLKVVGIGADGYREVLGVWMAPLESEATWSDVFRELAERGLEGVRYVVSDDHKGLRLAVEKHFPQALWHRCQVHFLRNVLGHVRQADRAAVMELLRTITQAPSLQAARQALSSAVEGLRGPYPRLADLVEEQGEEVLAVFQLPASHRRLMRSTNMVERLNQELRRRTRVIRIFPDDASCLRLTAALAMEQSEEWAERRYLTMQEEKTPAKDRLADAVTA
jgi:putative transposase